MHYLQIPKQSVNISAIGCNVGADFFLNQSKIIKNKEIMQESRVRSVTLGFVETNCYFHFIYDFQRLAIINSL